MGSNGRKLSAWGPWVGFLVLAAVTTACGPGGAVKYPEGSIRLAEGSDSDSLVKRFFPGYGGRFYVVPDRPESPVMGVIWNPKKPADCFFAGASNRGSWSLAMSLEGAAQLVTGVSVIDMFAADIRRDGSNDMFIVLEIRSRAAQGDGSQVRTALYVYELDVKPSLIWYQTLALEGEIESACKRSDKSYAAEVEYALDEMGRIESINVKSDLAGTECTGGKGCEHERECLRARDEADVTLTWDAELRRYVDKDQEESVLRIPDVSL
ncbi:MAG: hypothetical protein FJ109_04040 [Deltaproteobacteria bacterium]|nr:hypothetical protein [Deltaproteobacteria bacterium]